MRRTVVAAVATLLVAAAAGQAVAQSWKSSPTNSYYSSQAQQDRAYSKSR